MAGQADPAHRSFFSIIEENDDFVRNGDQHYTQGLRFNYLYAEDQTPDWSAHLAERIPTLGLKIEAPRLGYALGQNIYTPNNLRASGMITYDRPYAGYIYFGAILQRRGRSFGHIPTLDTFEFDLGLIGPASLAEQTQRAWHGIGGWIDPKGWRNQLKTEPGLTLKHERQWKLSPTTARGLGVELIPHLGVVGGNVTTYANAGAMLRLGYNIPDDFGVQNIDATATQYGGRTDSTPLLGGYLFVAVDGRAIAHNAFLDGNLWQPSHRVRKEPLVGDLKIGAVLAFRYADVAVTYVQRSREFLNQPRRDRFASISLNAKF